MSWDWFKLIKYSIHASYEDLIDSIVQPYIYSHANTFGSEMLFGYFSLWHRIWLDSDSMSWPSALYTVFIPEASLEKWISLWARGLITWWPHFWDWSCWNRKTIWALMGRQSVGFKLSADTVVLKSHVHFQWEGNEMDRHGSTWSHGSENFKKIHFWPAKSCVTVRS